MTELNLEDCPIFDECDPHGSAERIQTWANFQVAFDEAPVIIGKRERKALPQHWTMFWEHGFMDTGQSALADEKYAKIYAALFIFLWCKSVGVGLADHLAHSFVYSRKKFDKEMEARQNVYQRKTQTSNQ